jgi:hypothetical protein
MKEEKRGKWKRKRRKKRSRMCGTMNLLGMQTMKSI